MTTIKRRLLGASTALALAALATIPAGCATARTAPAAAPAPGQAAAGARPNVIFFLVDDLGWNDVGYAGTKLYRTPAIDQLARDGMRFDNAHVAFPRCAPSRFALMTGKNPARAGVPGGPGGEDAGASEFTMAEAFKEGGYATFFAGKWHIGKAPDEMPEKQGFDINIGGGSAGAVGSYFFPFGAEKGRALGPGLETGKPGEYITDRLTDETIKFIDAHQKSNPKQPFFAYLSHYAVHTPFDAKPELKAECQKRVAANGGIKPDGYLMRDGQTKKYQDNATYCAMVASMDESLGRIRAELKRLGIDQNTIIVFTSDHGGLSNRGPQGGREVATSNLPYRAGKGHNYEGGTRVPMLVSWPGHVRAGSATNEFTVNSDHYAALSEMAGLKKHPEQALDSWSYVPLLSGGKAPATREVYWHSPRPRPNQTGDTATSAVRIGDWKYIKHYDPKEPEELFNLAADPYENDNLATKDPTRTAALKAKLAGWMASVGAVKARLDRGGDAAAGGEAVSPAKQAKRDARKAARKAEKKGDAAAPAAGGGKGKGKKKAAAEANDD